MLIPDQRCQNIAGTPEFMAPEVIDYYEEVKAKDRTVSPDKKQAIMICDITLRNLMNQYMVSRTRKENILLLYFCSDQVWC